MTVTIDSFRYTFGEFVDLPDEMVRFWLPIAQAMVNADAWGTIADQGVSLALAHFCAMGGGGGAAKGVGVLTSKSVGGVSAGYDVAVATDPNAGHWTQTSYGTRFRALQQMFGAGVLHLGGASLSGVVVEP